MVPGSTEINRWRAFALLGVAYFVTTIERRQGPERPALAARN